MGGLCGSGGSSSGSSGSSRTRRTSLNDFVRNITEPDKLAAEMGTQEVIDQVPQEDRRFEIRDGNWITKPYEPQKNLRPDGTEKDDKPNTVVTPAAVAPVVEEEEEETTTTPPDTPTAPVYTPPNYTNPVRTESVQSVLEDQDRGPKSGTIVTSAQGISKEDTSGLRPKRKLKPKGLLNPEIPERNQSLLAAA